MQKIISLFMRNYDTDHLVRDEIVPGAEWVQAGEGQATRKWDGTCCLISGGQLYKRYDAKNGKQPPDGFMPAQEPDLITGHWPGWLLCNEKKNEDRWFIEGFRNTPGALLVDGTFELVGPKINSNAEKMVDHILIPHGKEIFEDAPRSFNLLRSWLAVRDIEGIVWHHPDGRMVKIKKKDFGLKREILTTA